MHRSPVAVDEAIRLLERQRSAGIVEECWRRRENRPDFVGFLGKMVEAAGVEPASERPVATEIYVRSRSCKFAGANKERRMRRPLDRVNVTLTTPDACQSQPTKWRSFPGRRLPGTNVAYLVRPRAQAANPQLRCFAHRFNERDGQARHASRSPLPPSKPFAPTREDR